MKKITLFLFFAVILIQDIFCQSSGYVVLTNISDTSDAWYEPVRALRNYRNAQVEQFSMQDLNSLQSNLAAIQPRYVAIVLKPGDIDINFVRKFLMLSTRMDNDPFSDFSYGFITGASAQDALNFVNRIITAETNHIEDFPLNIGGYAASSLNFVYPGAGDFTTLLNPSAANIIYLETNDNNSGHDFFVQNSQYLENCKVLDVGHNGDPHMLWLFEGGNTNPNPPVWAYDSAKIENPAYARAGLTSYDIASLNLYPAVAFNGACHSGEPKRVMIEGDIAATFGETNGYTQFYNMSDTFSFALSMLKAGLTGYFAPCGANNANDQGEDYYNAFLYNEPLGDIHKRSVDGVVMGFLGNVPNLKIYLQDEYFYGCDVLSSGSFDPSQWSGACYMLGGKANRIYFGDPLFNPFQNNHDSQLNITQYTLDSIDNSTLDIHLTFNKPDNIFFPVWDKFHFSDTRIYMPVELPDWCSNVTGFAVLNSSGTYSQVIHVMEDFDQKKILHIEVDIPNSMYDSINYNITFRLDYEATRIWQNPLTEMERFNLSPNPANNEVVLTFNLKEKQDLMLSIYNCQEINVKSLKLKSLYQGEHKIIIPCEDLSSGTYFLKLNTNKENITRKFLILKN